MNLTTAVAVWVVLGVVTLALALYRKLITATETDIVQLGAGDDKMIVKQLAMAARLASIDRWGKALTVVVVSVGIFLGIAYLYLAFHDPESAPALRNLYKQHGPNP